MKKDEMEFYWNMGICPYCRKNPLEPNRKRCYECLGYEQDRYRKLKESGEIDKKIKRGTERKMSEYYRRKESGFCTRCGKKPAVRGLLCGECYGKVRSRQLKRKCRIDRSERPDYGMCYICGDTVMEGKRVCQKCYAVRMKTVQSMFDKADRSYFRQLNDMHYAMTRGDAVGE